MNAGLDGSGGAHPDSRRPVFRRHPQGHVSPGVAPDRRTAGVRAGPDGSVLLGQRLQDPRAGGRPDGAAQLRGDPDRQDGERPSESAGPRPLSSFRRPHHPDHLSEGSPPGPGLRRRHACPVYRRLGGPAVADRRLWRSGRRSGRTAEEFFPGRSRRPGLCQHGPSVSAMDDAGRHLRLPAYGRAAQDLSTGQDD
ncbi:hypothetical protein D3C72_1236960 [compost metagenome]